MRGLKSFAKAVVTITGIELSECLLRVSTTRNA
jgi:hypothetical protein